MPRHMQCCDSFVLLLQVPDCIDEQCSLSICFVAPVCLPNVFLEFVPLPTATKRTEDVYRTFKLLYAVDCWDRVCCSMTGSSCGGHGF